MIHHLSRLLSAHTVAYGTAFVYLLIFLLIYLFDYYGKRQHVG